MGVIAQRAGNGSPFSNNWYSLGKKTNCSHWGSVSVSTQKGCVLAREAADGG